MAVIRLGGGAEARGSIGGQTYSRNRGGAYIRARVKPTNPKTGRQTAVRAGLSLAVNAWQGLTDAVRDGWRTYAANVPTVNKLGDQIFLTGQQMYSRMYIPRSTAAQTMPAVAPSAFNTGDPPTMTPIIATDEQLLTVEIASNPDFGIAGSVALVYMSQPMNASRQYVQSRFRLAGYGNVTTLAGGDLELPSPWTIGEGQAVTVRVRIAYADGRLSPVIEQRVIVGAAAVTTVARARPKTPKAPEPAAT